MPRAGTAGPWPGRCVHPHCIINDRAQEASTVALQAVGGLDVDGGDNSGEGAAVHARVGARPQHLGCAQARRAADAARESRARGPRRGG
eukprot:5434895-Prymnesium_polylepis.1